MEKEKRGTQGKTRNRNCKEGMVQRNKQNSTSKTKEDTNREGWT